MTSPRLPKHSLLTRFLTLMVALTMAGVAIVASLSLWEHSRDARSEARAIAHDRALTILDAIETAATNESLQRFVFSTAAQPAIEAIALVDPAGRVAFASRHAWQGQNIEELDSMLLSVWRENSPATGVTSVWEKTTSHIAAFAPISPINPATPSAQQLDGGQLILLLDTRPFVASARTEAWFDAAWAGGILTATIMLLAFMLHSWVGRPLQALFLKASNPDQLRPAAESRLERTIPELRLLGNSIDELLETRQALRLQKERLIDIANTIPGAVYECRHMPDGSERFTFVTAGIVNLVEVAAETLLQDPEAFYSRILVEDQATIARATESANRPGGADWQAEFRVETSQGIRWISGQAVPVDDPLPGQLFRGVLLDITERKLLQRRLELAATQDPLTELFNRAGFAPILEASLASSLRHGTPLGLAMFDIDHFKHVNDTFGHAVGDAVLEEITRLMKSRLRDADTLARWGGEEFLLLLPHTDREGAYTVAETLRAAVARHAFPHGEPLTISAGLATARQKETASSLIRRADERLYQAKHAGRNQVASGADCNSSATARKPQAPHSDESTIS